MTAHGVPWSRVSVEKLENGRRGAITVQELLALALVLDVPPIWLLADPSAEQIVPVADGVELDPWAALLWLIGKQPLTERPGRSWDAPALILERLVRVVAGVDKYRDQQRVVQGLRSREKLDPRDDLPRRLEEDWPEVEKLLLEDIARPLRDLDDWEMPVPPLPPDVRKRAEELGVELPAEKG
jgi:transcriptional regulator with XRE-family HTH domain